MKFINIGFGNVISAPRIVAIIGPDSAPIRRVITDARGKNKLIDATCGRKTRAVIAMDSEHIVLSALQPETIVNRFRGDDNGADEKDDELNSL